MKQSDDPHTAGGAAADACVGSSPRGVRFGPFMLDQTLRLLEKDGAPVPLGSRAFDILCLLVSRAGEVVTKDELMATAWPDLTVDEGSLRFHISRLRRALEDGKDGTRYVENVPGRGYQFIGHVRKSDMRDGLPSDDEATVLPCSPTNLPQFLSSLVGRDGAIGQVANLAASNRLVTLAGIGGIGKTRLAIEVARRLLPQFTDGVWIVELASLSDPDLLPLAIAESIGFSLSGPTSTSQQVIRSLRSKRLALVLDNCEHLVEAAARFSEEALRASPGVLIIATSRDPLRIGGEQIFQVPSLDVPCEHGEDKHEHDLLQYSAIRLFVERARAAGADLLPDEQALSTIAAVCRQLDGIPLAIELCAARAGALSVKELALQLQHSLDSLAWSSRTAPSRQRTLRATLDWSFDLLSQAEQRTLRRLSAFAGGFTGEAAGDVAAIGDMTAGEVGKNIVSLVGKSLVVADVRNAKTRYRLLQTTQGYAREKLVYSAEAHEIRKRHAKYYCRCLQLAGVAPQEANEADDQPMHSLDIDNVRAALAWAFSADGDAAVGVALIVASVPHWHRFSRIGEYQRRIEQALAWLEAKPGRDTNAEMQLLLAHAELLRLIKGRVHDARAAWNKALAFAGAFDNPAFLAEVHWGFWAFHMGIGEVERGLEQAELFANLVAKAPDRDERRRGDLLLGLSKHYQGDQAGAVRHLERAAAEYPGIPCGVCTITSLFEQQEIARAFLVPPTWIRGFPDRAMQLARSAARNCHSLMHAPSVGNILALAACPVALLIGDLETAGRFLAILQGRIAGYAFDPWTIWSRCIDGMLLIRLGEASEGSIRLQSGIEALRDTGFTLPYSIFLCAQSEYLASQGHISDALALIDGLLGQCAANGELWSYAELLRIKGETLLAGDGLDAHAAAERCFLEGLETARRQQAQSWELRCATSLAQLWHKQSQSKQALDLLAPAYGQFTEGFGTADLLAANGLIEVLSQANHSQS